MELVELVGCICGNNVGSYVKERKGTWIWFSTKGTWWLGQVIKWISEEEGK
ncbi:hypothetical protein KI387_033308, partial [Taxus chinensis]